MSARLTDFKTEEEIHAFVKRAADFFAQDSDIWTYCDELPPNPGALFALRWAEGADFSDVLVLRIGDMEPVIYGQAIERGEEQADEPTPKGYSWWGEQAKQFKASADLDQADAKRFRWLIHNPSQWNGIDSYIRPADRRKVIDEMIATEKPEKVACHVCGGAAVTDPNAPYPACAACMKYQSIFR